VSGLPFTIENVTGNYPQSNMGYWSGLATAFVHVTGYGQLNGSYINIFGATAATMNTTTALVTADIADSTQLIGTLVYRASS